MCMCVLLGFEVPLCTCVYFRGPIYPLVYVCVLSGFEVPSCIIGVPCDTLCVLLVG